MLVSGNILYNVSPTEDGGFPACHVSSPGVNKGLSNNCSSHKFRSRIGWKCARNANKTGWKCLDKTSKSAIKWCAISLLCINAFSFHILDISLQYMLFYFSSFLPSVHVSKSPVGNPWWVNSCVSRSEEYDLSSDSDSLSEESESETCVAHLKGFGKMVELGVAFVFTMHVWMIWIDMIHTYICIYIPKSGTHPIWSWTWLRCKVFKGQRSLMLFLNNNPI